VQEFIAGFIVAVMIVVPTAMLFLRRKLITMQSPAAKVPREDGTGAAANQYQRQFEELGKLTGGLAHEIKNPLSTVKINLKLIAEELRALETGDLKRIGPARDEQRLARAMRKISVIQKETDRLEQILDSFLQYVGRTELHRSRVDINDLVGDMVDFYSPQAQSHQVTIHQGLHEQPLLCRVDSDMLKQVLLNLFINAQQAMTDGGELMVRTSSEDSDAVIAISDTGIGIAADKLPHIFKAYYSGHGRGSGLGLPTARRIVEAHDGTISVTSDPGKGTCFTIRLPIK